MHNTALKNCPNFFQLLLLDNPVSKTSTINCKMVMFLLILGAYAGRTQRKKPNVVTI